MQMVQWVKEVWGNGVGFSKKAGPICTTRKWAPFWSRMIWKKKWTPDFSKTGDSQILNYTNILFFWPVRDCGVPMRLKTCRVDYWKARWRSLSTKAYKSWFHDNEITLIYVQTMWLSILTWVQICCKIYIFKISCKTFYTQPVLTFWPPCLVDALRLWIPIFP